MNESKEKKSKTEIITHGRKYLEVRFAEGKGRGVFTNKPIAKDKLIEECPILMIEMESVTQFDGFKMGYYIFGFDNHPTKAALLLGFGSLYNHASPSNAEAYYNEEKMTFSITAIRGIKKGEEITINYNGAFDHDGVTEFLDVVEEAV
ncbi:MAG: SET domain-containing protein-lysine N-methyltransferase [Chitinophagaceae bacterium]